MGRVSAVARRLVMALALLGACAVSWAADASGSGANPLTPPTSSAPAARPAVRQANNLAIITIKDMITAVTSTSVQRRIKLAEEQGADAIVIELDTPGGEVGAVIEITAALRATPLYTIAWIHDDAYSGGAIVAVACDEIVTSPAASFGDAGIVRGDSQAGFREGLKPTERAKISSVLIADLVESARANGYDEVLIQGLSALRVETWQVRDTRTGKNYFLTRKEYAALFGEEPREGGQAKVGSPGLKDDESGGPLYADASSPLPSEDDNKTVPRAVDPGPAPNFTPGTEDFTPLMRRTISDTVQTRSTRPDFSHEDQANYRLIGPATDGTVFLTLKGASIADFGFSKQTIANDEELKQYTGAQSVARLDQSWSEATVAFMTYTMWGHLISGLLIVIFLLGLFIELSMPGVGVAGLVALCAFVGLVIPPMMINASAWWTIAAILGGVLLLLAEVFVIPGFGVAGVSGLIALVVGLIGTFAPAGQLFPGVGGDDSSLAWAASIVVLAIFAAGAGAYLVSRYTQHVPLANKLILNDAQRSHASAPTMLGAMASAPAAQSGVVPIGAVGVALTRLMPSGAADFDGQLVDVVSEVGFVDAGDAVRVISSTTYRVAVERIEAPSEAHSGSDQA